MSCEHTHNKSLWGYVSQNIASCEGTAILEVMTEALGKANKAVLDKAKEDVSLKGMGTTIVTCLCDGEKYYCLTVGDSRIYSITEKEVKQLSHDHSYVQGLVDSGAITEKEARLHPSRNIITRAVGTDNQINGDIFTVDCNRVKGLLLCSDGLCGYIEHEDLQKICLEEKSPEKCAEKLIQKANLESGADNITAVVVKNS